MCCLFSPSTGGISDGLFPHWMMVALRNEGTKEMEEGERDGNDVDCIHLSSKPCIQLSVMGLCAIFPCSECVPEEPPLWWGFYRVSQRLQSTVLHTSIQLLR